MRVMARPLLLVARPADAFLRQWPLALRGEVEGVHQARVATRRLREALPLLKRHPRDAEPDALRAALRALTRALGPSRELDVSRLVLARVVERHPAHRAAAAATDRLLAAARSASGRALAETGAPLDVDAIVGRIRDLARRLADEPARRRCAQRAGARLRARAQALQAALDGAGRMYAPGPLHAVRIALKKFRYAFELAARMGRGRHDATIRRLKRLQDILGDLHDLQVLAAHVRDAGASAGHRQAKAFEALADHLDLAIRDLHSRYLVERDVLVTVMARAVRLARDLEAR